MASIKKNFIYQALYEGMIILMPLITSPYISRVLGAEAIGIYSYTYSIAYYFVMFAMLGISNYGNRLISSVRDNRELLNKEFSSLFCVHVIISSFVLLFYFFYCIIIVNGNEKLYAIIQGMFVASAVFDVNWFFFGLEEFKLSVTRNTLIKFISFICIFLFVKKREDLYIYCFIMAAGILGGQIAIWPVMRRYVSFVKFGKHDLMKHVKPLLVLFIPVLAVSMYKIMDKVMLGQMDTKRSLGYYENSEKIVSVFTTAISAFGTVMMPRMNNLFAKGEIKTGDIYLQRSMKGILIVTYAVAFGVIGVAPDFVVLFWGSDFINCSSILSILMCSFPFVAFASVLRMQYLIPKHMDKIYIISVFGGAIINLIINYLLIPKYAGVGAAFGTLCAEGFVCLYQAWRVHKETKAISNIFRSIPFLLIGIMMCAIVRYIGGKLNVELFGRLVIEIIVGGLVYIILGCVLLHKEIALFFSTKKIQKRSKRG